MIAKRVALKSARKSDFAELANYLTDAQGNGARVGQVAVTNCEARTFEAAMAEVLATQRENTRALSDKTYHLIVSFRAGEQPDEATLRAIEARLCEGLGYGEHQRLSVVHRDTGNLHVHIAINKIHPARRTLHEPYRDHRMLARLCEELERDHALQRDNHLPRQHGAASRAEDMERHAGADSLLGWIRRECLGAIEAAQSWSELHQVLHMNGLELRVRGNGLVVAAGEDVAVKASSISRELSAKKLEARFGPFEPSPGHGEDVGRPVRQYRQPGRAHPDTAGLYARYKAEQRDLAALRCAEGSRARDRKARLIEAARRRGRLKRAAIRLVGGRLARKVLYAATHRTLAAEIEQIRKAHLRERRQLQDRCKHQAWEPWLRARATEGDEEARKALRAREAAHGLRSDTEIDSGRQPPAPGHMARGNGIAAALQGAKPDTAAARFFIRFDDSVPEQRLSNLLPPAFTEETSYAPPATPVRGRADRSRPGSSRVPIADLDRAQAGTAPHVAGGRLPGKPDLGRAGGEPPPQSRHRLRTLSELGVVRIDDGREVLLPRHVSGHLEQQGAEHADGVRRPVPRSGVTAPAPARDAADRYIAEREEKRSRGIDIPRHLRYSRLQDGPAEFAFAGARRVDGQPLALLKSGEDIVVLPIDEATARRLGRLALGERLTVTPKGTVRVRSRSR